MLDSRENLDERGLARSVTAEKRVHVPPTRLETHALERLSGPEGLGNTVDLKCHGALNRVFIGDTDAH